MRTLSSTARASAHARETSEVWLTLLTISHASISPSIRVVDNTRDIVSNGETFIAFPFGIELPGEDPDQPLGARLRIDGVDRRVVNALRSIQSPPTVKIDVILASIPDTPEISFDGLVLRNATYGDGSIEGELNFEQVAVEPVATNMTPSMFPGLF